jgi:ATP-dependent RNA helicase SUPV3L1/SUV3
VLSAHGLRAVRGLAVPVERLERLDELLRAGVKQNNGSVLSDQALEELGWSAADAQSILRGVGFVPAGRPAADAPIAWRRRAERKPEPAPAPRPHSPFAALAALKDQPAPARRVRRRRRKASGS